MRFRVGDHVCWTRAMGDPSKAELPGIVRSVFPCDSGLDDFTMYDVEFDFGTFTLYGTQIEPE
jgi:hypothetical protein